MDHPAGITDYLVSLGLPGIVILALGWTCLRLFNLYVETTNKRLEESGKSTAILLDVTNQLKMVTQALESMTRSRP